MILENLFAIIRCEARRILRMSESINNSDYGTRDSSNVVEGSCWLSNGKLVNDTCLAKGY